MIRRLEWSPLSASSITSCHPDSTSRKLNAFSPLGRHSFGTKLTLYSPEILTTHAGRSKPRPDEVSSPETAMMRRLRDSRAVPKTHVSRPMPTPGVPLQPCEPLLQHSEMPHRGQSTTRQLGHPLAPPAALRREYVATCTFEGLPVSPLRRLAHAVPVPAPVRCHNSRRN